MTLSNQYTAEANFPDKLRLRCVEFSIRLRRKESEKEFSFLTALLYWAEGFHPKRYINFP